MNMGADSFQYDPLGRRVAKTALFGTTNYLYDGANPVQELSGTTPTANLLTGLNVDEYFERTDSTGTANFLTDALGSTLSLTDPSGNTLASYTYEPFGNTTVSGTSASTYQYTGRENDGTGLYFYRARYYSPTLQRFISEDPLGMLGSGPNLYAYAADSPTNWKDPAGTAPYGPFNPPTPVAGRKPQTPIWWLQTEVFVSGLGNNFINEFEPNGCFAQFADELVTGESSDASPPGAGPEDVIRTAGETGAAGYAIGQGLSYPLKSSIYRGILAGSETAAGVVTLAPLDYEEGNAFVHEMQSLGGDTCQ